jgi:hypothetical protein
MSFDGRVAESSRVPHTSIHVQFLLKNLSKIKIFFAMAEPLLKLFPRAEPSIKIISQELSLQQELFPES